MNAIKALRNTTNMSQSKFAAYLGIPVANIQHWEQGVANPPNYLISLITRVMKYDGYLKKTLSPEEIDAVRQTQATLSIERLTLDQEGISEISKLVRGEITREQYQNNLRGKYIERE